MFDALSTRLQDVFQSLSGEVRLTPETTERVLREIRVALSRPTSTSRSSRRSSIGCATRPAMRPSRPASAPVQQVVKIVRDELLGLFGDAAGGLSVGGAVPTRHPDARPAGLGQDHDHRQAGPDGWPSRAGIRWSSRPTCVARPPSSSSPSSAARRACASTIPPAIWTRWRALAARSPRPATPGATSSSSTPPAACTSTTSS